MIRRTVSRPGGVVVHVEDSEGVHRGTPVLLVHGFGASAAMWRPNRPALEARRRVLAPDLRGHGETVAPHEPALFTVPEVVADLVAVLDEAGVERAIVGGMSLGGFLALRFALDHPDRLCALLLVDTGPGYRNAESRDRWNHFCESVAGRLEREGISALAESPELARTGGDPRGLALAARGLMVQHDAVISSLDRIDAPTLVVVGALDEPFLAGSRHMASRIPGAELAVIKGAGHAANLDQVAEFDRVVADFLERRGPDRG